MQRRVIGAQQHERPNFWDIVLNLEESVSPYSSNMRETPLKGSVN